MSFVEDPFILIHRGVWDRILGFRQSDGGISLLHMSDVLGQSFLHIPLSPIESLFQSPPPFGVWKCLIQHESVLEFVCL
jgi:hypothetical protein